MNPLAAIWRYLLIGLTAIGAFLGFFLYAKREGKKEEQAAETEKALEQAKESNEIIAKNRALSDTDARSKLRDVQRD